MNKDNLRAAQAAHRLAAKEHTNAARSIMNLGKPDPDVTLRDAENDNQNACLATEEAINLTPCNIAEGEWDDDLSAATANAYEEAENAQNSWIAARSTQDREEAKANVTQAIAAHLEAALIHLDAIEAAQAALDHEDRME